MVGTIVPVVHGRRGALSITSYAVASVVGAATLGLAAGGLGQVVTAGRGSLSTAVVTGILGAACLLYAGPAFGLRVAPMPQRTWQVPRQWRVDLSPPAALAAYGYVLGLGVFTRIGTALFYPAIAWAVLRGDPLVGAGVFAVYGLGRAAPLAALARTPADRLADTLPVVDRYGGAVRLLEGVVLVFAGVGLLALVVVGR